MRFWQCLAMLDMRDLPRLAQHAEALGFEGINLADHLVTFATQYEHYDYTTTGLIRWYPETEWPDPWVQIAALSQAAPRLRFTTSVYVLPMRDPLNAAKSISTAAQISGGRVVLGLGVGWQRTEFDVVGQRFANRGRRTDEMIEVLRKLWTGEVVEHEGEFYSFPPLQMSPGLDHPLPIWVGGTSPSAFARAARHEGWLGAQHSTSELEGLIAGVRAARATRGATLAGFDVVTGLTDYGDASLARAEELGVTVVYRDAFCDEKGMPSKSSLDEKLRDMDAFANRCLR